MFISQNRDLRVRLVQECLLMKVIWRMNQRFDLYIYYIYRVVQYNKTGRKFILV